MQPVLGKLRFREAQGTSCNFEDDVHAVFMV
jgi:hypothetical protein